MIGEASEVSVLGIRQGAVEGEPRERGGREGARGQAEGQGQSVHAGPLIWSDAVGRVGCVTRVGHCLVRAGCLC